ncbi:MAG: caspase family protein, partial [Paracoccaceae bacterium]|nr:caspase family protein [Paracoccaceae bacterium]
MPRFVAMGLVASLALTVAAAAAEERIALVIGNGAYLGTAALANPVNDATAIATELEALGFTALLVTDATGAETVRQVGAFTSQLAGARIALLYFAGHGIQIGGENYLLPTDVSVESEWAMRYSAIAVQEIVKEMEARAEVSLVLLDACRDNPFPEQLGPGSRSAAVARGLGVMNLTGKGGIIAYAAAAGRVASDGGGPHSPYTEALLAEIGAPGVEVGLMLRRVAGRVIEATHGQQRPELLVRLIDEVYLNEAPTLAPPVRLAEAEQADEPTPSVAGETARTTENGDAPDRNGRPTGGRDFFGDRLVAAPDWLEGLAVPAPTGWSPAPAEAIVDPAPAAQLSDALALPLAAAVETRLAERGRSAWYEIEVPTAGEIRLLVPETPEEIDVFARVYDADRAVVADWQGAPKPGGALDGVFPVPGPGRYWLELTDGNRDAASPAPFVANVDFAPADDPLEPNPSIGRAWPVPSTVRLNPTVFPRGDRDWLEFWIDRPGLFTAEATQVPEALDIAIRVWNYDGRVVRDWVVPARQGGDTFLEAGLKEPGRYFLEIADGNNNAASVVPYALALDFAPVDDAMEPNDSFGAASIQAATGEHRIAIFPRGDADWVALDVDHPGQLQLQATEVPEDLDVYMRVWTADKSVLRDWFGPPRPGGDVDDFADLPRPGRYFVEIADGNSNADSAASFPLGLAFTAQPDQFEPNNGAADAKPLTPGGEILFNILPRGDADWFRIEAPSSGELSAVIDPSPPNLDL